MNDVSIVVVSYNVRDYVERCLTAVADSPHELIVVDNASDDGTPDLVRGLFPSAELLELAENRGFGAAANAGMRAAGGDLILLLNPDARPVGPAVEDLVACARRRPRAGAIGPSLIGVDGAPQRSAFGFPTAWWTGAPAVTSAGPPSRLDRVLAGMASLAPRRERRIFLVGAVLLVRREAVEQAGWFDETFFMFNEDVDLCWRMWEHGWAVELCEAACFVHVGGASVGDWTRLYREQVRGHLRFVAASRGVREAARARRVLAVALRLRALGARGARRVVYRETAAWIRSAGRDALMGAGERDGPR